MPRRSLARVPRGSGDGRLKLADGQPLVDANSLGGNSGQRSGQRMIDPLFAALHLPAPQPVAFFAALGAADARCREAERVAEVASYAPPIRRFAACPCGATLECRDDHVTLTDDERYAAMMSAAGVLECERLADLDDPRLIDVVIDTINRARDDQDYEAMHDFDSVHECCRDDLGPDQGGLSGERR